MINLSKIDKKNNVVVESEAIPFWGPPWLLRVDLLKHNRNRQKHVYKVSLKKKLQRNSLIEFSSLQRRIYSYSNNKK